MTREFLEENWEVSSYNENTKDQLDYYIHERKCEVGDKAYLYNHDEDELIEMEIIHIICRSNNEDFYDGLPEDILIAGNGNCNCNPDAGAEFITKHDCYLIWFKYV